jgi:hypothetical protein
MMYWSVRTGLIFMICVSAAAQTKPPAPVPEKPRGSYSSAAELPDAPSKSRKVAAKGISSEKQEGQELTVESVFEPLSNQQKFQRFLSHTVSPYTFVSAGINSTWLQINGDPSSYGGGVNGWMKRFAVSMTDTEARAFFSQYFFPMILNQDPRYIPMRKGNLFARGWYAATRVVVGRSDNGNAVLNTSYLLSVGASKALSSAYAPPDKRNLETALLRIVGAYGSDAGSTVLEEFWPDIIRLFRSHAPKPLRQIEAKMPAQLMGVPVSEKEPQTEKTAEAPGEDESAETEKNRASGAAEAVPSANGNEKNGGKSDPK